MKTILLAGGKGTRLMEETTTRPKPMVEIGGQPILWHLMQLYAAHGFKEFLIACGYKGEMIKEYFRTLPIRTSDYVMNLADGSVERSGLPSLSASRVLRSRKTYGRCQASVAPRA